MESVMTRQDGELVQSIILAPEPTESWINHAVYIDSSYCARSLNIPCLISTSMAMVMSLVSQGLPLFVGSRVLTPWATQTFGLLRVLLGCVSMGIIILPRVPLLAARERSSVEMLLDASSPSPPTSLRHLKYKATFMLSKRRQIEQDCCS